MRQVNCVVITQVNCEWCDKAKKLLSDNGIGFGMCSIDHQGATELRRMLEFMKIRTVPAIFMDGHYIGGYKELRKEIR